MDKQEVRSVHTVERSGKHPPAAYAESAPQPPANQPLPPPSILAMSGADQP